MLLDTYIILEGNFAGQIMTVIISHLDNYNKNQL